MTVQAAKSLFFVALAAFCLLATVRLWQLPAMVEAAIAREAAKRSPAVVPILVPKGRGRA